MPTRMPATLSLGWSRSASNCDLVRFARSMVDGLPKVDWAGFYLLRAGRLELGPFHGDAGFVAVPSSTSSAARCLARREPSVRDFDSDRFPAAIWQHRCELAIPVLLGDGGEAALVLHSSQPGRFRGIQDVWRAWSRGAASAPLQLLSRAMSPHPDGDDASPMSEGVDLYLDIGPCGASPA